MRSAHAFGEQDMKKSLLVLAGAVALAGSATAADMPAAYKASPPAPVFTWTGCYLGGNGGGGRAHNDWQPLTGLALAPVRASGWSAGLQAGCDYQVSSVVFGVEGQFDWADMHGVALVTLPPGATVALQLSSKLDRFATATGRIGYAFDRVLLYAKGGAAWAHYNHEVAQTNFTTPTVPSLAGGQSVTGFVVGGGVEVAFLPNWSFKAEYNYFDFGTNSVLLNCVGAACFGAAPGIGIPFDIHQNVQTFMVGVNYRFGGLGPLVARY
jgi:outer membrane immunogenic protein